ncbi:TonB-dependent receptor [Pseudomonas qingdaonensis]|nr:TonB-dependent receptor [Pseudomonas qingdaonensis]
MLNSFATEAGVVLSFDNGLTEGKQSRGINGRYSIDQGFAVLLSGSGLQAVAGGDNSYVLLPAAPSGSLQLDATNVTGSGLGAITEDSGSYTTGSTTTATRMNLSLRETPQSISVVTRQQMDDQNMQSLEDVARAATGISTVKGSALSVRFTTREVPGRRPAIRRPAEQRHGKLLDGRHVGEQHGHVTGWRLSEAQTA